MMDGPAGRELERAARHLQRADLRLALTALDAAAAHDGAVLESPEWWRLRAAALGDDPDAALTATEQGLAVAPGDRDLLMTRAEFLAAAGRLAEAEDVVRAAIGTWPDEPRLLSLYATVLSRGGEHDAARAMAEAALHLDPGDETVLTDRMHLALAAGEHGAERLAETVLRHDPANYQALHVHAQHLMRRGDRRGAAAAAAAAAREVPGHETVTSQARAMRALDHWSNAPNAWLRAEPLRLPLTGLGVAIAGAAIGGPAGLVVALVLFAFVTLIWPNVLLMVRSR